MNTATFLFGFVLLIAILAVVFRKSAKNGDAAGLTARIEELGKGIFQLTQQLDARLREAALSAERGQERATQALGAVSGQLGEQRTVLEYLKRFQDLLQPPKARGGIGERLLEQFLADIMPEGEGVGQYQAQYSFRSGERVDFILRLKDVLVPIDSKFPMEAYGRLRGAESDEERTRAERDFRQAVKQHIDAVSKKYIRPDEGTVDFAFLYIPSEAVYLAFVADGELVDFAFDRRVIVVSPGTFFAYLRTVLIGLRGFAIEESARELLSALGQLEGELNVFQERYRIAGGHLRNAQKAFDESERQLARLIDSVARWSEKKSSS